MHAAATPRPRGACFAFADPFAPAAMRAARKARSARSLTIGADVTKPVPKPASETRSPAMAMFEAASPDLMPKPPTIREEAVEVLPAVAEALPSFGRFTLVDLPAKGCKWPTAEEDGHHLFCGVDRENALRPYCAEHRALSRRVVKREISEERRQHLASVGRQSWAKRAA